MVPHTPTQRLQTYILKGYGAIEPQWVQSCLHLFKLEQVNLRKVILLKNNTPDCFSMLEIHFLLAQPEDQNQGKHSPSGANPSTSGDPAEPSHPFLQALQGILAQQTWQEQSIQRSFR